MSSNPKESNRFELDLAKLKEWRRNNFPNGIPFLLRLSDLLSADKVTLVQPTWWGVSGKFVFFLKTNRLFYVYEGWWSDFKKELEGDDRLTVLNVMWETLMHKYPESVPHDLISKFDLLANKLQEKQ